MKTTNRSDIRSAIPLDRSSCVSDKERARLKRQSRRHTRLLTKRMAFLEDPMLSYKQHVEDQRIRAVPTLRLVTKASVYDGKAKDRDVTVINGKLIASVAVDRNYRRAA